MKNNLLNDNFMSKIKHGTGNISFPCFIMLVGSENFDKRVFNAICDYVDCETDFVFYYGNDLMVTKKYDQKELKDYRSPMEYAKFLSQFVYEETGKKIKIVIGKTINSYSELPLFVDATVLIGKDRGGEKTDKVYTYKQNLFFQLLSKISSEEKSKFINNIEGENKSIKQKLSAELVDTAKEFLRCDLNALKTSRRLYIHRNTLNYRLDKIEKILGLNLRVFDDAVSFYTYLLLGENNEK